MASGVVVRFKRHISSLGLANCAGDLQQERCHRCKSGNSQGKSGHRTNAHAQLSNQGNNANFTAPLRFVALPKSSVRSS
jgi:hypothetical protein